MEKKSYFLLSGLIALSFYVFICVLVFNYISTPKAKNYKSKATTIELDMIVIKSDKKRIEKKQNKKVEKPIEKVVKKSASVSNEKKPDVKSLFGKVKVKNTKVIKKDINNIVKSIDPKRFKSKFEKEKKSSNVKIDNLLNDRKTTTNRTSSNSSKNKESDDYYSKVNDMLSVWTPTVREEGLQAKILIIITRSGKFDYRFINYSRNDNFDLSLKAFLEEQKSIIYPKPKKGKTVRINVDFKSEG